MVNVVSLVKIRENDIFERAFRRFKKSCERLGVLAEVKKREHFEKPSIRLKKKREEAKKRNFKTKKQQQRY